MNRLRLSRLIDFFVPAFPGRGGLFVLLCLACLPGCLLLNWSTAWFSGEGTSPLGEMPANKMGGKIPAARNAVTLQIVFVERPANDPLLGSQLWDEVDQIGSLSAEDRKALMKAGFRIGRVGANPPLALQKLMGMTADITARDEKRIVSQRFAMPSGVDSEISIGQPVPQATIELPLETGSRKKTFENMRGVFRMNAKQLQDGWARIEFLPEIHYGRVVNRPTVTRGSWQLPQRQAIERLYRQKFSLDLNVGEMVVITGEPEQKHSLGKQFFHASEFTGTERDPAESETPEQNPEETSVGIQRLLIIRLADLSVAESLYSDQ